MGKIFTSLKFIGFYVLLTSAAVSYWNSPTVEAYEYPKNQTEIASSWYDSPQGIFAFGINECENDNIDPTASSPSPISVQCSSDIPTPNSSVVTDEADNCTANPEVTFIGQFSDGNSNPEIITRTYKVTDEADNSIEVTQVITVHDITSPSISASSDFSTNTDAGQCSAVVALPDATFSDNCSGSVLSWTMAGATTGSGNGQIGSQNLNIGETTITYTVTDGAGNTAEDTVKITIFDREDPTVSAAADFSTNTDAGKCFAVVALPDATFDDNCSGSVLSWTMTGATTGSEDGQVGNHPLNIGETAVTYTVTDGAGNKAEDTVIITILDRENPTVSAVADFSRNADAGKCSAVVALPDATFDDNCSGSILSWIMTGATTGSGEGQVGNQTLNLGETIITYTVTDGANNTAEDAVKITILDEEKPTVSAVADFSRNTDAGQCSAVIALPDATFGDNCSGSVLSWTMAGATTGSGEGQVGNQTLNLGETIITYTVTDGANNTAEDAVKITILDEEKPTVSAAAGFSRNTDSGECTAVVAIPDTSFDDNCTGIILSWAMSGATTGSGDGQVGSKTFNLGETIITYTVTDGAGNTAEDTVKITILDEEKPNVSAVADLSRNTDIGTCSALVAVPEATFDDNCSGSVLSWTMTGATTGSGNGQVGSQTLALGETIITYTVTDGAGNTGEDVLKITITDIEKPVITAGEDITAQNISGQCYAGVSEVQATASDNCSVGSPVGTRSDGEALNATYPVGTTTVTWTVTDANGNEAEPVTQLITIEDKEAPKTPELEDILWGCEYTVEAPTVLDNCDNLITATTTDETTLSTSGEITWIFEDMAGNVTEVVQNITIDPVGIEATNVVHVLCNGHATGSIKVEASGGVAPYTYDWGSLGSGDSKTDLSAGTYSVKAFDANGCETDLLEVVVTEPETFVDIRSINTTAGCFQEDNGTATVQATGGTGAYTYSWSNGETTSGPTVEGLAPGTHSVTVTDENGCSRERTFTVSQPQKLEISGFMTTETTLYGSATGTATAQVMGGTPNYTFVWSNGQTGQTAKDLAAGTYTVTVTDANGCSTFKEVTIVDSLDANIVPTSICKNTNDVIRTSSFKVENLTVLGGTAPYDYYWTFEGDASIHEAHGPQTPDITYETIGDKVIHLTITDSNGLTLTKTIIQYVGGCFTTDCGSNDLVADNFYIGDEEGNPVENCETPGEKYIYIYVPSNPDRYSLNIEIIYSIHNIETGEIQNLRDLGCFYEQEAIPDRAQTFPIAYTCGTDVSIEAIQFTFSNKKKDECGEGNKPKCYSTNNEATVHSPLYAVAFASELLCFGSSDGIITARASGGKPGYQFRIKNESGNIVEDYQDENVFYGLQAGIYFVEVIDTDGTVFPTRQVEIKQPQDALTLELEEKQDVTCFGGNDGWARVKASGGTPGSSGKYIYSWEGIGQTTATATNLAAGTYTVNVLDANGCEVSLDVTIAEPAELLANAGPDQVLECGNLTTTLAAVFNPEVVEGEPAPQGTWSIVNGPAGGVIADVNDPHSAFSGNIGTYTLRWEVPCGTSDDVKITFTSCSRLDFDGINDHVVIGDKFDLPSGFTIEAWVKQDAGKSAGKKTVLSKRDNSALNSGGFDLIIDNSTPKFRWNGNVISSDYPIGTDRWYHLAVIVGGEDKGLYIDGIKVSDNVPGTPSPISQPVIVGAAYNSETPLTPENYFHGWIEEVRIWKKSLDLDQVQFLMNQRLKVGSSPLEGTVLPLPAPGPLNFNEDLIAYYPLIVSEITNGNTIDKGPNSYHGKMVNIKTSQQNTAPLPYYSATHGQWTADDTWLRPAVWDYPNSKGIDGSTLIDWNIVVTKHNITSQAKDITVLGLLSEAGRLTIADPTGLQNEKNSGQSLRVSRYLLLDGDIDLVGESQLLQDVGSILDAASSGSLERDQQGTASSYNYNYWTSPVSPGINASFSVKETMKDGTITTFRELLFGNQYHFADGGFSNPRKVSNYWLHKFHGTANNYYAWEPVGSTGTLKVGEGYSMKGTSGYADVKELQNYTFVGMPNNDTITLRIEAGGDGENYLVGNPYPSAIDANEFILDNLASRRGGDNIFNGSIYFWDHFAGKTHYLQEYIGGYATYNLSGGTKAISNDDRINNNDSIGSKRPGQYIPVGQAFFVNSMLDPSITSSENVTIHGGDILFKNSQRTFKREGIDKDSNGGDVSVFHSQEKKDRKTSSSTNTEERMRIWIKFRSPAGYHRQLLVTADRNATTDFDLGYDGPMIDDNKEDLYWLIKANKFVIQGVPDFNEDRILPLGIRTKNGGEFRIAIDEIQNIPDDFPIYVKDSINNSYHNLRDSDFIAEAASGPINDRYSIVFSDEEEQGEDREEKEEEEEEETPGEGDGDTGDGDEDGGDTGEADGNEDGDQAQNPELPQPTPPADIELLYSNRNQNVIIQNTGLLPLTKVVLYNTLGQEIFTYGNIPVQNLTELPVEVPSTGVYFIRVHLKDSTRSLKFIVE